MRPAAPVRASVPGPLHRACVERINGVRNDPEAAATALAALLVLRMLDRWQPAARASDAFSYQASAAWRHVNEAPATDERAALAAIIEACLLTEASADAVGEASHAYGLWLEQVLRLDEAADVLRTVLRAADALTRPVALELQLLRARVSRKRSRFDDALTAYRAALGVAEAIGDEHAVLVSRLGQAAVTWRRGNLPEAKRGLTEIAAEARAGEHVTIAAAAEHELGVVLDEMGRLGEAIRHTFEAHALYPEDENKLFALHDVGVMLMRLGDHPGAEHALSVVRARSAWEGTRTVASIGLLELAIRRGDEIGFRRWLAEGRTAEPTMPDELRATFYLKWATGEHEFGRTEVRDRLLGQAEAIARAAGLHALEFEVARTRDVLRDPARPPVTTDSEAHAADWAATREVAAAVKALADTSA